MALVQKGATSFHASEELWRDSLQLNTDMQRAAFDELREGWEPFASGHRSVHHSV